MLLRGGILSRGKDHFEDATARGKEPALIPWEFLDHAPVPGSKTELCLYRRGQEYSIRVDRDELMNSRVHGSEEALAKIVCARLVGRPRPRILIGGLGMGYTLAAALRVLAGDGEVVMAELSPAVVRWNRGPLASLAGSPLEDQRVTLREEDVGKVLQAEQGAYDGILLDVDNGPEGFTRQGNDWLYARAGLAAAFAALRPAGVFAVWSASPDRAFSHRLRWAGFHVESLSIPAGPSVRREHTIWIASRRS